MSIRRIKNSEMCKQKYEGKKYVKYNRCYLSRDVADQLYFKKAFIVRYVLMHTRQGRMPDCVS